MPSSASTRVRPIDGRSEAPTIAIERGRRSRSSDMGAPSAQEHRDQHAEDDRAHEQGRHHGDNGIRFEADRFVHLLGQVTAPRPPMKSETTASLNDERNANSAPTTMPGRSTG